jgi:uncharacterized protein YhdP
MIETLLKKLWLLLVTIILVFTFAITSLHMLTPVLNKHKQEIEHWLSTLLNESVTIGNIQTGWHYFEPIIALHNIKISDPQNSPTSLNYIAIDFNIWRSLINWQLAPKKILVKGSQLKIIQKENGTVTLMNIGQAAPQQIELSHVLQALRVMQLQIKNMKIELQTKDGSIRPIEVDSLTVKNIQDRYRVYGEIQIANQTHSKIKFNSNVTWKKQGDQWFIQIPTFEAKSTGFFAEGQGQITLTPQQKTKLSFILHSHIKNVEILKSFLPLNVMRKNLKNWLMTALIQGEDINSKVIFDGNIEDFPFKNNEGIFIANSSVRNLNLNYKPGWAPLHQVDGEVLFRNLSLKATAKTGTIDGATVTSLNASIPNIASNPKLEVNGELTGTLTQLINFLQTSPLSQKIGDRIQLMQASGPMQLKLQMHIPLHRDKTSKIIALGNIHTDDGQLKLNNQPINLNKMQADLQFHNYILTAKNIKAQFLGQSALMNVETFNTSTQSPYYAVTLASQTSIKELSKQFHLTNIPYLDGNFAYEAGLNLYTKHDKVDKLIIHSNLQDLSIDLPKPFGKKKGDITPSRLDIPLIQNAMQMTLHYSDGITAVLKYQTSLNNFNIAINSPTLTGNIQFLKDEHKITARLQHLTLDNTLKKSALETLNPSTLPDLDLRVNNFRLGEYDFGNTYLSTEKISHGLKINTVSFDNGYSGLNATGEWTNDHNQNNSYLRGLFYTKHLSQTLKELEINPFMDAKNVNINFNLGWNNTPLHFDPLHANGDLAVQTSDGTFYNTSDQANALDFGRMLTLLSLQSLPRRLTLNFNDLTLQGFSFDSMSGYLTLSNGDLSTNDLLLKGIVANVGLHGNIDLIHKQIYLLVHITPHLTSSLPVIATIAGGPIAGIATFFATTLLSSTVDDIAARYYQIQGDWKQPLIKETRI